jgi:MFS superfamily sulfate permease-like transporter
METHETNRTRRFLPGLTALAQYDRSWFRMDLVAGLSVAAVAIPTAIAYSQLAGVPPVHGLYASILPLVAYAFFGTSRQLIVAPDAATCAVVATIVLPLAAGDLNRIISLTMVLSMLTGVFCVVAGLARLGFLTNFLARPILVGYLNGIALSIISGQLGRLFGFSVESAGFFRLLIDFFVKLGQTHWLTLAIGVGAFVLLRGLKYLAPKFPAPLIAMALGIAASSFFNLGQHGVALLGSIPAGLPGLMIPNIVGADWQHLVLGAAGLALISFNSGMVTARGFAVKNRYEIDSNQEFIALGMADLGSGLMQGFAVSGADSRTAVNDSMGGKTQLTSLVTAGLLVLVLLFLTAPLAHLPIAILAAVLINAALGLFDVGYI